MVWACEGKRVFVQISRWSGMDGIAWHGIAWHSGLMDMGIKGNVNFSHQLQQ